ncbi:DDE Tnp4 domain-containing protein [Mycena chlorophos]|uniref:DDE Tnp4 domain-containing protein n=1 Tax=Mycena chlorophos TaxID=658473 RepID=A0A8H6WI85_MYCCL|nr:DDE Tnp4 domain-containing protein [Mycena chlorophos]
MAASIEDLLLFQMRQLQDTAAIVVHLVACTTALYSSSAYWVQPYHTSKLSGHAWVQELVRGNPERIYNELGVHLHVFIALQIELRGMGYGDSKYITLEEQLAIFLYVCRTGLGCRNTGERFQRSNGTITKCFQKMLNAFSEGEFYNKFVRLPTVDDPPPAYLLKNEGKLWPFFRNCLGALDGLHIACTAAAADRSNTRNHKGFLSQNVLAVCSFSLRFIYILSGWEGSVSDASLWADARINDFPIPAGYYYLGDAGFPLTAKLITPLRSTQYHLQEWALGRRRPQTREELFNLRHAQARNVIERIFGVIKKP